MWKSYLILICTLLISSVSTLHATSMSFIDANFNITSLSTTGDVTPLTGPDYDVFNYFETDAYADAFGLFDIDPDPFVANVNASAEVPGAKATATVSGNEGRATARATIDNNSPEYPFSEAYLGASLGFFEVNSDGNFTTSLDFSIAWDQMADPLSGSFAYSDVSIALVVFSDLVFDDIGFDDYSNDFEVINGGTDSGTLTGTLMVDTDVFKDEVIEVVAFIEVYSDAQVVPEPATGLFFMMGLMGMAYLRRKKMV